MTWDLRGVFSLPRKGQTEQGKWNKGRGREKGFARERDREKDCTDDLGLKGRFFFVKERTNRTGKMEQRKGKGKRAGTGKGPRMH